MNVTRSSRERPHESSLQKLKPTAKWNPSKAAKTPHFGSPWIVVATGPLYVMGHGSVNIKGSSWQMATTAELLIPLSIKNFIANPVSFRLKKSTEQTVTSSLKSPQNEIFDVLETSRPPDLPQQWYYPPNSLGPFQWMKVRQVGRGLLNYANTCFLNATIQALAYCPAFAQDCLIGKHGNRCCRRQKKQVCGFCQFECHIKQLFDPPDSQSSFASLPPLLVKLLRKEVRMNQGIGMSDWFGFQNCAHEWLVQFLDFLSKYDLPPELQKDFEAGRVRGSDLATCYLQQMFSGCFQDSKTCHVCHKSTANYELNTCIRVPINGFKSLESALQKAFQPELLTGSNRPT